jgi:phosphatidylinositol glycan class V
VKLNKRTYACRNVGAWRYYELKQVPNFVLAGPILLLSFSGAWSYLTHDPVRTISLGLKTSRRNSSGSLGANRWFVETDEIFVYIVHWAFLSAFALVSMHVQVSTRFLASQCPPLYWFCASSVLQEGHPKKEQGTPRSSVTSKGLVLLYFRLYFVIGTVLFSCFYPWT